MSASDTAAAQAQLDSTGHLVLGSGSHVLEGLRVSRRQHIECRPGAVITSPSTAIQSEGSVYESSITGGEWKCGRWGSGSYDAAGVWQSAPWIPGTLWQHSGASALQLDAARVIVRGGTGWDVDAAVGCLWDACSFRGCVAGIRHTGHRAFNADVVRDCQFQSGGIGVSVGGGAGSQACGVLIAGCWFEGLSLGVAVRGNASSISIEAPYFEANGRDVHVYAAEAGAVNRQIHVTRAQFANATGGGPRVVAEGRSEVVIDGGTVRLVAAQALLHSDSTYECRVQRPTIHYIGAGTTSPAEMVTGAGAVDCAWGANDLSVGKGG